MKHVFLPKTIEDAQAWLRERLAAQQPFAVRGANSRFHPQEIPPGPPFPKGGDEVATPEILSTAKLTRTNFFDPDDMVVGVEAGMTVAALQALLAEQGMVLPVNPWFAESTIGAAFACNDNGPNRLNMGGFRDCVIGIEYLNGNGERVHAGGKVVKNVSGYDLCRMQIGSLGGLGVITALNFKVIPQPVAPHGLYGRFPDSTWQQRVAELHSARIPVDWIQAFAPAESGSMDWLLGIGFSGNAARQQRIEREIQTICRGDLQLVAAGETPLGLSFLPGTDRFTGWVPKLRQLWKLPAQHLHLMTLLTTSAALHPTHLESIRSEQTRMVVHPIGADLHCFLDSEDATTQREFIASLQPMLRQMQAKLVLGNAASAIGYSDLGEFAQPPGYALVQRLKRHLDPAGVFHAPFYEQPST